MLELTIPTLIIMAAFIAASQPSTLKQWMLSGFVVAPFAFFVSFLATPTIALDSVGIYVLSLVFAWAGYAIKSDMFLGSHAHQGATGLGLMSVTVLVLMSMTFTTWGAFHSDEYRNILNVQSTEEFNASDLLLDQSQARFVDQKLAGRAASEVIGGKLGMGSRYKVGSMSIQNVNDELIWVAPFGNKKWTKWLFDGPTTPGYTRVSSRNFGDSEMVTGEDVEINYGTDGFYGFSYIPRHLYVNGYNTVHTTDYTMELNDQGKPYWVVSIFEKTVGFSGRVVSGVLIVDAKTGAIEQHGMDDIPAWVDRVQPESIINEQIADWGGFIDGWLNKAFVGNQVVEPTPGTSLVYSKDGRPMWYTGIQSNGQNQQGTMGFMLVDTRTGEATFYRRAGITETVAMTAVEGRVQEYDYKATYPIPYNVNGVSTFISVLKDKQGNPQMIGMVAYDNRSLNAVGEDLHTATRRYQLALANESGGRNVTAGDDAIEITGVVVRLGTQQVDESASIHFMVDTPEWSGRIFTANTGRNVQTVLTEKNDTVKFKVNQTESDPIIVKDFENLSL